MSQCRECANTPPPPQLLQTAPCNPPGRIAELEALPCTHTAGSDEVVESFIFWSFEVVPGFCITWIRKPGPDSDTHGQREIQVIPAIVARIKDSLKLRKSGIERVVH